MDDIKKLNEKEVLSNDSFEVSDNMLRENSRKRIKLSVSDEDFTEENEKNKSTLRESLDKPSDHSNKASFQKAENYVMDNNNIISTKNSSEIKSCRDTGDNSEKHAYNVAVLGFPCDIGVQRNAMKIGARNAPNILRKTLLAIGLDKNPEFNVDLSNIHLVDRGNVNISDSLEESHISLVKDVTTLCADNDITIVIGGGHDQSYPVAKGLMNSLRSGKIGVINVDAHLDVRPLHDGIYAHSGSPFRQLLEDVEFQGNGSFCEFGVQGSQCSIEHANYVESKGGKLKWLSQLRRSDIQTEFKEVLSQFEQKETFVSICIDAVVGSDCPGVNFTALNGFSAEEAFDVCFLAGQHQHTKLLDISEFNPLVEVDLTTQLISNMIYYFLMGVSTRAAVVNV